jgi:xylulose-5-phosphate/fructose-6-phosphate phosphoketolase
MFNQHAKWLEKSKKELDWRAPVPSINFLITSLVWRQDYNGFTHQDPGFLDVVTNKSPDVVRILITTGRKLPAQCDRSLPSVAGLRQRHRRG